MVIRAILGLFLIGVSQQLFVLGELSTMPGLDGMNFGDNMMNNFDKAPNESEKEIINIRDEEFGMDVLDEDQQTLIEKQKVRHEFQSETNRLMDMFVNFLYTKKEVAFRELISNAADALEKVRHNVVMGLMKDVNLNELSIKLDFDKEKKTISITDNGIGMSREELMNNLGIMAKSGTINYLETMAKSGDTNLIGQFGVGFYSVFLVADYVTVTSKNDKDDQHIWASTADRGYTIVRDPRGNKIVRGTRVTLHLKDDALNFLDAKELTSIVMKYSQFVQYPIYIRSVREVEVPNAFDQEDKKEEKSVTDETESDDNEKKSEDETKTDAEKESEDAESENDKEPKKSKKTSVPVWERINAVKAIWMRPTTEITDSEYKDFYKSLSKSSADPLTWIHFKGEGEVEFRSIMYIPSQAPNDMFDNYFNNNAGIKLYARRVLVAESMEDLIPKYLQFVRGVIDSDDLPLNVSREHLQQNKIIKVMSKKVQRKIFEAIRELMKKRTTEIDEYKKKLETEKSTDIDTKVSKYSTSYDKFYENFGKSLKLGCYEDDSNRNKLVSFFKFYTTLSPKKQVDFESFVKSLPEDQKIVYYAAGESVKAIMSNPQIQIFKQKKIPVLLLTEAMDEPCIQKLTDYEGRKFESIQKGSVDLPLTEEEKMVETKMTKRYQKLMEQMKNALVGKVSKVEVSRRLVDDPCAIVASKWGHSAYMERVIKSQTFSDPSQVKYMASQRVLEINPRHSLVNSLLRVYERGDNELLIQMTINMYNAAMLSSGFDLENPSDFSRSIYNLLKEKQQLTTDIIDVEEEMSKDVVPAVDEKSTDDESKSSDNSNDSGAPGGMPNMQEMMDQLKGMGNMDEMMAKMKTMGMGDMFADQGGNDDAAESDESDDSSTQDGSEL